MGMDLVELVIQLEDKYEIEFPDNSSGILTVQDLTNLVINLVQEQKNIEPDALEILQNVMALIQELSNKWFRKPITPDAKLTDVLSM